MRPHNSPNSGHTQDVRLEHVTIKYGRRIALEDISIHIPHGSMTAIVGPNGSGKSTLLKALMGLVPAARGKVSAPAIRSCAYLPQHTRLNNAVPISVVDVVAMGLWSSLGSFRSITAEQRKRVADAIDLFGLSEAANLPVCELSGGQLQRALFARLMLQDASLILLDEPFNNLDEPTALDLLKKLKHWHQQGLTILVVIHDLDFVKTYFDTTLLIARKLVAYGPTHDVLTVDNLSAAYTLGRGNLHRAMMA